MLSIRVLSLLAETSGMTLRYELLMICKVSSLFLAHANISTGMEGKPIPAPKV